MKIAVKPNLPLPHTLTRRDPVTKQVQDIVFAWPPVVEIKDEKFAANLLKFQPNNFFEVKAGTTFNQDDYKWRNQYAEADFTKKFNSLPPKGKMQVMTLVDSLLKTADHKAAPTVAQHSAKEIADLNAKRAAEAKARADAEAAAQKKSEDDAASAKAEEEAKLEKQTTAG